MKNISYKLIDSGNEQILEQYGDITLIRHNASCVWTPQNPAAWNKADAECRKQPNGQWEWHTYKDIPDSWPFTFSHKSVSITTTLHLAETKNLGIFPEQENNWRWMIDCIAGANQAQHAGRSDPSIHSTSSSTQDERDKAPLVLNLFGYTGAATLCAAAAGASVCHVDASKAAVSWARKNQEASGLNDKPIRWIVDDCATFVKREIKRGVRYDGIILDPPAFGRDTKGKIFSFQRDVYDLLALCKQVISDKPLFVIFNGYSMGYSGTVLYNLLLDFFPEYDIEYGELVIPHEHDKRLLTASIYARFKNN